MRVAFHPKNEDKVVGARKCPEKQAAASAMPADGNVQIPQSQQEAEVNILTSQSSASDCETEVALPGRSNAEHDTTLRSQPAALRSSHFADTKRVQTEAKCLEDEPNEDLEDLELPEGQMNISVKTDAAAREAKEKKAQRRE